MTQPVEAVLPKVQVGSLVFTVLPAKDIQLSIINNQMDSLQSGFEYVLEMGVPVLSHENELEYFPPKTIHEER